MRSPRSWLVLAGLWTCSVVPTVIAQLPRQQSPARGATSAPGREARAAGDALVAQTIAGRGLIDDAVRRLNWRSVGPANNAGRISVVVGIPGDPLTYYVAGANGGIIKTTNAGTTFKPIFDKQDINWGQTRISSFERLGGGAIEC